jgi:hypothetical protein
MIAKSQPHFWFAQAKEMLAKRSGTGKTIAAQRSCNMPSYWVVLATYHAP